MPSSCRSLGDRGDDEPEIDGVVHLDVDDYEIEAGDFIEVDVVRADQHDLFGQIVGE